jgi:hypothetical protein
MGLSYTAIANKTVAAIRMNYMDMRLESIDLSGCVLISDAASLCYLMEQGLEITMCRALERRCELFKATLDS